MKIQNTSLKFNRLTVLSVLIGIGMLFSYNAFGAAITWGAPASGDWATASNWTGGVVPGANDDVTIASGKTVTISSSLTKINKIAVNGKLIISVDGVLNVEQSVSNTPLFDLIGGEVENAGLLTIKNTLNNSNTVLKFSENSSRDDKFTNTGTLNLDNLAGSYSLSTGKCIGLSQTTSTRTMLLKLGGTLNLTNIKTSSKFIEMDGAVATIDGSTTIGSSSDYKNWKFINIIANGNLTFATTANITMYSGLVNTDGAITASNTAVSGGVTNNGSLTIHNGSAVTGSAIYINPAASIATTFTNNKDIIIDGLSPVAAFNIGNANASSSVTITNASTGTFSITNTSSSASAILTSVTPTVTFTNGGTLNLAVPAASRAMYFGDNSATFTNNGTLNTNNAITGNDATTACIFNNNSTGIVNANLASDLSVIVSNNKKITFNNYGTVTGIGILAAGTFNTLTGTLNPGIGTGTGILRIYQTPYTLTGKSIMQINGTTTAGTNYDQIVFGFSPSGTVAIDPSASLEISKGAGYTPIAGDKVSLFSPIVTRTGTFTTANVIAPANWYLDYSSTANASLLYAFVPSLDATSTVSSIASSTATSGGNIPSTGGSNVTARGVCWGTTTLPTIALSTKTTDGTGSGSFSSSITNLTANTLYYVRSYSTNSIGTSYGVETSFTTLAIHSITTSAVGAGNVTATNSYDAGTTVSLSATPTNSTYRFVNWKEGETIVSTENPYQFPAVADRTIVGNFDVLDITITGGTNTNASTFASCTTCDVAISGTNTIFTVDEAKEVHNVTIAPGSKLDLSGTNTLTVNGDLTFSADNNNTFSANIGSGHLSVTGTVSYVRAMDESRWYFMAFPFPVTVAEITNVSGGTPIGSDMIIKWYNGGTRANGSIGSNWITNADAVLTPNRGYIFGIKGTANGGNANSFNVRFIVPNASVMNETVQSITIATNAGTGNSNHWGWNLISQPYMSIYDGSHASGVTYVSIPDPATGNKTYNQEELSATSFNPFDAYFVQYVASTTISFALTGRTSAPSVVNTDVAERIQLNFASATGTDKTSLIMDNANTTAYEGGFDLEKMIGIGTAKPQVYTVLGGVNYAFNALPMTSVVNLPVGVYSNVAGPTSISVDGSLAPSLSKLLLTDTKAVPVTVTDLLTKSYSFTATSGTDNTRFLITAQRVPTENNVVETNLSEPTISLVNGNLLLKNICGQTTIRVFDAIGRLIANKTSANNTLEINHLAAGMYSVQIESREKTWVKKIVIK